MASLSDIRVHVHAFQQRQVSHGIFAYASWRGIRNLFAKVNDSAKKKGGKEEAQLFRQHLQR